VFHIIIQARLGSTRLPNKVIAPIFQWSAIEIQFKRLCKVFTPEQITFAIPNDTVNDLLAKKLTALGATFIRGSEANVYQRFYQVLAKKKHDFFIRLTADCPLISPNILNQAIGLMELKKYDVIHTAPSVAEGLDFEIINTQVFKSIHSKHLSALQLEHPTLYFYENSLQYNIFDFTDNEEDQSQYRITLDEPEDLHLLNIITEHFKNAIFTQEWPAIKQYLDENPQLLKINQKIIRNEGLKINTKTSN
jgi:spore coat polysaccharide biosynthesis protein SpsF (cytidylyltransferase family)